MVPISTSEICAMELEVNAKNLKVILKCLSCLLKAYLRSYSQSPTCPFA